MYYAYTGCITFKPLGFNNAELPASHGLSDPQFQGHPCSMKELHNLALQVP